MDLDSVHKLIQIVIGFLTICGTLYGAYRLFRKRAGTFARARARAASHRQGKQCPRCRFVQARRAAQCRQCRFQFTPHRQRRR